MRFVRFSESDIDELIVLERSCFAQPWTEKQFALSLRQQAFHLFGFKSGDDIVAYCAFYRVGGEMEILNIAVAPESRRQGLGSRLLGLVMDINRNLGVTSAVLEVRPSNQAARQLYARYGFASRGVRKGYYPDNGEDALILGLDITQKI